MAPEILEKTIGQKLPAVVSQTVSVQCKYRAAPSPRAHGSRPNTTTVDFAFCSFNEHLIVELPDDAAALGSI
jgi:hypothetical protein